MTTPSVSAEPVSAERLAQIRKSLCVNAGYQHIHDSVSLVSAIDELIRLREQVARMGADLKDAQKALFAYHDYVNGPHGEWSEIGQRAEQIVDEQRARAGGEV